MTEKPLLDFEGRDEEEYDSIELVTTGPVTVVSLGLDPIPLYEKRHRAERSEIVMVWAATVAACGVIAIAVVAVTAALGR